MKKFYSPTQWSLSLPIGLRAVVRIVGSTIDIGIAIDYDRQHLDWKIATIALKHFYNHLMNINPAIDNIITNTYIVICDIQDSAKQYPIPVSIWVEPTAT